MRRFLAWPKFGALLACGILISGLVGCGGIPADDALVITALCEDGTLATSADETGCDSHGGAKETYVGGLPPTAR